MTTSVVKQKAFKTNVQAHTQTQIINTVPENLKIARLKCKDKEFILCQSRCRVSLALRRWC